MKIAELNETITIKRYDSRSELDRILDKDPHIFRSKRLKYFLIDEYFKEINFVATIGDKIVGVAGVERNPYATEPVYWIKHVSVDPEYSGRGIARQLLEEVFKWASDGGYALHRSSYTRIGKERLDGIFGELVRRYPDVKFTKPSDEHVYD